MLSTAAVDAPPELLIIRDVRAFDPSGNLDVQGDIVLERGVITRVGRDAAKGLENAANARVIDGRGKLMLPRSSTCTRTCVSPDKSTRKTSEAGSPPRRPEGTRMCA